MRCGASRPHLRNYSAESDNPLSSSFVALSTNSSAVCKTHTAVIERHTKCGRWCLAMQTIPPFFFSPSPSLPHPLQAKWHFHFKIASRAPLWIESNYAEKHRLILSEHNSFHHLSQSQQVSLFLKYLLNPVQEVIVAISLFQNG